LKISCILDVLPTSVLVHCIERIKSNSLGRRKATCSFEIITGSHTMTWVKLQAQFEISAIFHILSAGDLDRYPEIRFPLSSDLIEVYVYK
jgi:hypothetical protein